MNKDQNLKVPKGEWSPFQWVSIEKDVLNKLNSVKSEREKINQVIKFARKVLKTHSTSFFIVTRFLPKIKRNEVELVYGSVRYPDEIVDSFNISINEKKMLLKRWRMHYKIALKSINLTESLSKGVPVLLAGFVEVIKKHAIPFDYYESFLDAMELDLQPRNFKDINDLIDNYIFGSAIVVGYFLAYVYGNSKNSNIENTLKSSKDLGIALQLTNFVRDIDEDSKRGRIYIPETILSKHNIKPNNLISNINNNSQNIIYARKELAIIANDYYEESSKGIKSFSDDSRIAITSCIDLYGKLNSRIITKGSNIKSKESLSWSEKLESLPKSKYWRLPIAYIKR